MSKKIKFLQIMATLGCTMALSISPIMALENAFFVDPNVQPSVSPSTILGVTGNDLDAKIKELNKKWETIQKDNETLNQIANLRCELLAHIAQNQDFVDRYTTYTHSAKFLTSFETTEALVFDVDSKGNYTEVESEKISLSQVAKFITIEKHADKFTELIKALKDEKQALDKLQTKEEKEKYLASSQSILKIADKEIFNSSLTKGKALVEKLKETKKLLEEASTKSYQYNIEILSLFSEDYTILDKKVVEGKDQVGSVAYYKNEVQKYQTELEKLDELIALYKLDVSVFEKICPLKKPLSVTDLKPVTQTEEKKTVTQEAKKDIVPNTGARRLVCSLLPFLK